MKKIPTTYTAVMLVSAVALLAATPARAEFGIGINVGNLGFGVEARQVLSPSLDLRFGIAGIAYHTEFEYDDIDYDIEQSAAVPEVKLDWRPAQGIFRLTFGVGYYNEVSDLELTPEFGTFYTIGNTPYTAAQVGTLNGKVSYHVFTPYFGVGWDILPKNKNIGFTIDVGAYYRNEPDVTMTSTGTVSATDLALEAQNIKDDAWAVYPVVKLGMLFRF
jgi:hypothetical protein